MFSFSKVEFQQRPPCVLYASSNVGPEVADGCVVTLQKEKGKLSKNQLHSRYHSRCVHTLSCCYPHFKVEETEPKWLSNSSQIPTM